MSLQASNWQYIGNSSGRGRQDRDHLRHESAKAMSIRWRPTGVSGLGSARPRRRVPHLWPRDKDWTGPIGPSRSSAERRWATSEGVNDWWWTVRAVRPNSRREDVPAVKGYYRLIDQSADSEVTPDKLLGPHRARTRQRMQAQSTVLCRADGTDGNFTTHPQTSGLGTMGTNQTGAQSRGLYLHSTLAINADDLPLGVLRARFDAPQPKQQAPTSAQDKKSFRWIEGLHDCATLARTLPNTQVVNVADRDADCYALLAEQQRLPEVDLIVRARANRRLPDDQEAGCSMRCAPRRRLRSRAAARAPRPASARRVSGAHSAARHWRCAIAPSNWHATATTPRTRRPRWW